MKTGPTGSPETSVTTNQSCVTSQKNEGHIFHYRIHKISPLDSILSDPLVSRSYICTSIVISLQILHPHMRATCSTNPFTRRLVTAMLLVDKHKRFGDACCLQLQPAGPSETSVCFFQTTRRLVPRDRDLHSESLKCHTS